MIKTKTYSYQIDVQAVPYQENTVEHLFGKGSKRIENVPEDTMGREIVLQMVADAITFVQQSQMKLFSLRKDDFTDSDKEFLKYLEAKEKTYNQIRDTIKPLAG